MSVGYLMQLNHWIYTGINMVKPHIMDLFRLIWLAITNLYWVIDNATDELVGGSLAPWYMVEELFIAKYKRLPFRHNK